MNSIWTAPKSYTTMRTCMYGTVDKSIVPVHEIRSHTKQQGISLTCTCTSKVLYMDMYMYMFAGIATRGRYSESDTIIISVVPCGGPPLCKSESTA